MANKYHKFVEPNEKLLEEIRQLTEFCMLFADDRADLARQLTVSTHTLDRMRRRAQTELDSHLNQYLYSLQRLAQQNLIDAAALGLLLDLLRPGTKEETDTPPAAEESTIIRNLAERVALLERTNSGQKQSLNAAPDGAPSLQYPGSALYDPGKSDH